MGDLRLSSLWIDEVRKFYVKKCIVVVFCVDVIISAATGCKGERVEAPKSAAEVMDAAAQRVRPVDGITWPDPPSDGSPVAGEFLKLVEDDGDLRVELRLFNLSEKPVELVEMELRYLGSDGAELKRFPWKTKVNIMAQSHGKYVVGAFLPPETSHAAVQIHTVVFGDGSRWTAQKNQVPSTKTN